ncbi:FAD/NAD(P)-binding protein [Kibdelosporangium philippinense]|uniref:FAD/NAD(P)-binding protein n=1 Tax=Kibdelosporangium philippinense TaxID=211113 RepID=A0ABS8ZCC6_9PSEU|nr:FAD/NAD(P)-binding protein [Kibdelosporangium philippinense]MCE7004663.1 FAD/NAD(P)-binding protein [Kibdelosporangium philippinense]
MSVQTSPTRIGPDPWVPHRYWVAANQTDTADTSTLTMRAEDDAIPSFLPGQFTMLYVFGVGEIPVSISGDASHEDGLLVQTVRDVGAVSHALRHARRGTMIGVRGPFGTGWDLDGAAGTDLVLVAGGIGLAPLRPALLHTLRYRRRYRRITLIAGAKAPAELLYTPELAAIVANTGIEVVITVDHADQDWHGHVGLVTKPLAQVRLDPGHTTAMLCGPEPMMRFSAELLMDRGVAADRIQVSLERNMKCGIGLCGHCQLGPLLVCRDGPVVTYEQAAALLEVREL